MTLGHQVFSPLIEVDQVIAQAAHAGAQIIKPAQANFPGGYTGDFQDPNGHVGELVWNLDWENDQVGISSSRV